MSDKTASIHWEGRGKNGVGKISTQTDALKAYPYGFGSRFEDDRSGTNPEELLAAAHAACFTMAFSFACDAAGFATAAIDTQAAVRLVMKGGGFQIDHIALRLEANVPGVDEATSKNSLPARRRIVRCRRPWPAFRKLASPRSCANRERTGHPVRISRRDQGLHRARQSTGKSG
jgi:osmotically inducible protein OsmC